jgi:hypothetical protein
MTLTVYEFREKVLDETSTLPDVIKASRDAVEKFIPLAEFPHALWRIYQMEAAGGCQRGNARRRNWSLEAAQCFEVSANIERARSQCSPREGSGIQAKRT